MLYKRIKIILLKCEVDIIDKEIRKDKSISF